MNPGKTYGGKSGVWLTKKRRIASSIATATATATTTAASSALQTCTTTTLAQDPSLSLSSSLASDKSKDALIEEESNSYTTCVSTKPDSTIHTLGHKPFYNTIITRRPRNQVLLLKGSRHVGSLPKKYLIEQRKRTWQQSHCGGSASNHTTQSSYKRQRQQVDVPVSQSNADSAIIRRVGGGGSSSNNSFLHGARTNISTRIPSPRNTNDRSRHNLSDVVAESVVIHTTPRIAQSPNVRLLGWDSMKCRPIYNCTGVNSSVSSGLTSDTHFPSSGHTNNIDTHLHIESNHSTILQHIPTYPSQNDVNNRDDEYSVGNYDDENDDENEDPNEIWRNIVTEMNENARKMKLSSSHRPKTYGGGSYATTTRSATGGSSNGHSTNNRKGLSYMPQSVLERLVSPKRGKRNNILNTLNDITNTSKRRTTTIATTPTKSTVASSFKQKKKKVRRKIHRSPKVDSTTRRTNQSMNIIITTPKSNTARKALNRTRSYNMDEKNRDRYSIEKLSPSSNSITSYALLSNKQDKDIMTPKFNRQISNICLEPCSDVSKDVSLSSSMTLHATTKESQRSWKQNTRISKNRLLSPPSTLHFPENLEYDGNQEEKTALSFLPNNKSRATSTSCNEEASCKTKANKTKDRCPKVTKTLKKKTGKNKQGHHQTQNTNKKQQKGQQTKMETQINQISSSTSLAAAKAFFEKLDRYEMTIA